MQTLCKLLSMLLFAACLLAGCSGPGQQPFIEGQELVARGEYEKGMQRIWEALRLEPTNGRYRSAYLQARDTATNGWIAKGDAALATGDVLTAESWYRAVLAMDPNHPRARTGLERLRRSNRHAEVYAEADRLWKRQDAPGAVRKLREILTENPKHPEAVALLRRIEDAAVRPVIDPDLAVALKKPLTIEFRDTPIRQVFEVFARTSGLNFIFDRDVRNDLRVTIFFRNSTVESAMKLLLVANQLEYRAMDANSVLVYPNTAAKIREYQPLVGKVFFLNNADVKQVLNTIRTIVKTRDIIADEKQNMIIMRDSPDAIRIAERLVAMHDMPEPEVMLEVEVLEVARTRLLELGIQLPTQMVFTPLGSAPVAAAAGAAAAATTAVTIDSLRGINGSLIGASVGSVTANANRTLSDINLLSNPRIRTRNKEKAKVVVGERVPTITTTSTSTGFVSESVQYLDVGLKLEVEPTIYPDDEIAIKIGLEVSTLGEIVQSKSGTTAFRIGTRNASTVLRLKDGENQVLAGLISDEDRSGSVRVPGLGDIPILGRLFGSQRDQANKTEIVLSITPRLVRNTLRPSLDESEFFTGTEASLRNRGVDSVQAGAVAPLPGLLAGQPPSVAAAGPGGPQPAGGPSSAGLQGPTQVRVGSTFTVQVTLQAGEPVSSVPVSLGYDARLLEVASVAEGDLLRQGGGRTSFSNRADRGTGQVFATATRTDPGSATGSGTVMSVTFRALAPAPDVRLQLLSIAPLGPSGQAVNVAVPAPLSVSIVP